MPWIDVDEPFAASPLSTGPLTVPSDRGIVDVDDRWGSIEGSRLEGTVALGGCERLEIRGSVLHGVSFESDGRCEIDVDTCELVDCDLSTTRLRSISSTRVEGCKLTGCDLAETNMRDVELVRCLLRLVNARMSDLERVVFAGCTLDDVDLFDARLAHVSFPESALRAVDVDRVRYHHVDVRAATELDLRSCGRLDGCLITSDQVVGLAFALALASGASVERPDDG